MSIVTVAVFVRPINLSDMAIASPLRPNCNWTGCTMLLARLCPDEKSRLLERTSLEVFAI
jgi:hypothetical protein